MRVDVDAPKREIIEEAVRVIRRGGIVLYPSDTIYGLGCDPFHEPALERLYELKGRNRQKGFLLLVPDENWVSELADPVSPLSERLVQQFWPGPVTILLKGKAQLPQGLLGVDGKIGLRCPAGRFMRCWLESLSAPIVSTSANRSGHPPATTVEDLRALFAGKVDLFLEAGDLRNERPSTVLDLGTDEPQLIRRGVNSASVECYLGQIAGQKR